MPGIRTRPKPGRESWESRDDETYEATTEGVTRRGFSTPVERLVDRRPSPYQHESIAYFSPVMDFVLDFRPDDTCLTTSSSGWGIGIWIGTFSPLLYGLMTGYYSGSFDPELTLEAVDEFEVNVFIGVVPTANRKLVNAAGDETDDRREGELCRRTDRRGTLMR